MNILITGGLGYLGSHICVELLLNTTFNIIVVDNLSNSDIKTCEKIYKITNKTIKFYNVDIKDFDGLNFVFNVHKIDKVIHLAALKSVNESVNNPLTYYDNNVNGTINLLKVMKLYNVNFLVFSSSATVYKPSDDMLKEEDDLQPCNPYGHTKLMIEQILKDMKDLNCVILRYFNPIGNHSSGILIDIHGENLIPHICKSIINNTPLNIYGNDYNTIDGTGIRDYIHVCDLAKAHTAVLNCCCKHIYNLGTGKGTSVLQLINEM